MSGAPTATTVFLSLAATINYSDGSSDTLPANTLAVLPDATTVFDRTHDVYVCYTVQTSGVLSVIKESLLPTLTSAYAPLCRIELHGIKPYQPEPYLAAGGLGSPRGSVTTSVLSATTAKAKSLWTGSSNTAPPAGWADPAYDDSAWGVAVVATFGPGEHAVSGSAALWSSALPLATGEQCLLRQSFVLPAGVVSAATITLAVDDWPHGAAGYSGPATIYVNGTATTITLGTAVQMQDSGGTSSDLLVGAFRPGASNVLGLWIDNVAPANAWVSFDLEVTSGATGGLPAPSAPVEGDLLCYHNGQWQSLPVGTSGQELTVVSGDPAWATPAAGYTDPLTTKGDLLTRSGSATVRLGVGSNGQVVTADSSAADGIKWATPAASGVTSIDVAAPSPLSSTGGPVTASGTISLAWASGQTANRVLASPDGTTGAVSLRALVGADIPVDASTIISSAGVIKGNYQAGSGVSISGNTISATGSGGSVTSVALSLPGIFSVSGSPVTTSGTLVVTLASQSQATVFAGPASGAAAAPTFRALAGSDLPAAAGAGGHIHAHAHFL